MIWELSLWKQKPHVSDISYLDKPKVSYIDLLKHSLFLKFISTSGKTKGTHRSSATSEDYCHRKKITSLIDSEDELSETHKFATTKQERSILADYRARKAK
ncbi:Uncharacterized protein APZ42_018716 [Daphnia magna]|uniref:Uncharacterized protein n=1 Tax=Daphnia magna TaxID=35525 RepID=A0A0N8D2M3_9CRUS|nr:Uncharacterized protein APZ42_018716 [Daphnia magna]